MFWHGQIYDGTPRKPTDARTAVGVESEKRLLFLAVFENASEWRALEKLAQLGAVDGMLLDGGNSTSMALGGERTAFDREFSEETGALWQRISASVHASCSRQTENPSPHYRLSSCFIQHLGKRGAVERGEETNKAQ